MQTAAHPSPDQNQAQNRWRTAQLHSAMGVATSLLLHSHQHHHTQPLLRRNLDLAQLQAQQTAGAPWIRILRQTNSNIQTWIAWEVGVLLGLAETAIESFVAFAVATGLLQASTLQMHSHPLLLLRPLL